MRAERIPLAGWRYRVEMAEAERIALLHGLDRFRTALSVAAECDAVNDLVRALRDADIK